MIPLFAALMLLAVPPQAGNRNDALSPVAFLAGRWKGTGTGEPGTSSVEREYQFVLGGRFLQEKNISRWAPRGKDPKGEVHEEWGFMSFDKARKTIVFRQFHVEGFVNQYALEPVHDPNTLVFSSEAIENIAPGWRARETYRILGPDEFEEVFELAGPGKNFELYSKSRLRRKK